MTFGANIYLEFGLDGSGGKGVATGTGDFAIMVPVWVNSCFHTFAIILALLGKCKGIMMEYMRHLWWILLFVVIRLGIAITFPVFNDESIYVHWSQIVADYGWRGLTPMLMDGKQPGMLIVWSLAQQLMGNWQPFLALRLLSIGFGLMTAILAFRLITALTGKPVTFQQQLLYAVSPGLVWFESLGLQESAVMTGVTAMTLFAVLYKQQPWMKAGGLLGVLIGICWWIKPTALIALPAVAYRLVRTWRPAVIVSAVMVAGMVISLMWLHPEAGVFWDASRSRVGDTLSLTRVAKNLVWMLWWGGALGVWGMYRAIVSKHWLLLSVVVSGLLLPVLSGSGIYTARYIAGVFPVLAAAGLLVWNKKVMLVQAVWSGLIVGGLVFNPLGLYQLSGVVPAVKEDLSQYMEHWTSGWGVAEAIAFADSQSVSGQKAVMVRLDSGNPESAVMAAFWRRADVLVLTDASWPKVKDLLSAGADADILFISRDDHLGLVGREEVELLRTFDRPLGSGHVGVWRVVVGQAQPFQ
jgi:hypothetical protein